MIRATKEDMVKGSVWIYWPHISGSGENPSQYAYRIVDINPQGYDNITLLLCRESDINDDNGFSYGKTNFLHDFRLKPSQDEELITRIKTLLKLFTNSGLNNTDLEELLLKLGI